MVNTKMMSFCSSAMMVKKNQNISGKNGFWAKKNCIFGPKITWQKVNLLFKECWDKSGSPTLVKRVGEAGDPDWGWEQIEKKLRISKR